MTEPSEPTALRMDAYYYGFEPTGVDLIDRILSPVACAGKAYHYTEAWTEETPPYEEVFRGKNPVEWIQNAANDAASALSATLSTQPEPVGKPEPNPEWEAKAKALREATMEKARQSCMETGDPLIEPAATLTMLERWTADAEPANEHGQITFSRAMLESAEDAIRHLLDQVREMREVCDAVVAYDRHQQAISDQVKDGTLILMEGDSPELDRLYDEMVTKALDALRSLSQGGGE